MNEHFFSGYCRQLDGSRMVEVILEAGQIDEIDCCYGDCKFQNDCPIAKSVDEILND